MNYLILIFCFLASVSHAQSPVGASTSDRANEVATNTQRQEIQYLNISKDGPLLIINAGEIKSNNASFKQKVTSNNIADFGELELSRANFKITKNPANAKYVVKFDVLKAEQVAKAKESFSGGAIGGMLGGFGGAVLSSVKTKDASEVWIIGMRWQAIEPATGNQQGSGYVEDRMELGSKGTSVMGMSQSASGGATLDTMVQYLVQKAVADMDMKMK